MSIIVDRPIEAGRLPAEIRGTLPPGTLVRVSYEIVRTENGLTPEEEAEVAEALAEAGRGDGLSPTFDTAEEMLEHLHRNVGPARE